MSRITDLERLAFAAKHAGLSRREFLERAAQAGIIAGAAAFNGSALFAQTPTPPSNVRIGTGFVPAPGLSLVGSISNGSTLTISKPGGGFGAKPHDPKPLLWMPFDTSAAPSSLGRVTSGIVSGQFTYSGTGGADGAGCYVGDASDGVGTNAWTVELNSDAWSGSTYDWNSYGLHLYVYRKAKKTFGHYDGNDYPNKNIKILRTWGLSPSGGLQYPCYLLGASNGRIGLDGLPNSPYMDYGIPYAVRSSADGIANAWYVEEFQVKGNTDGATPDADLRWEVNGGGPLIQFPCTTWGTWHLSLKNATGDDNDGRVRRLYAVHYVVEGGGPTWVPTPAGNRYYADDLYVDDSWCRVMISDESSWPTNPGTGAGTSTREIQIPTAWADGSISFVLRQGQHASLSGKSLYVILQDGTALKAGLFA
jgi:hypothetical protein